MTDTNNKQTATTLLCNREFRMMERSAMKKTKVINLFEEISIFKEILTDNSKVSRLFGFFFKDNVSTRRHELLRGAMAFLYGVNKPIDVASLISYFYERELLEAVGGRQYLRYIAAYNVTKKPPHDSYR